MNSIKQDGPSMQLDVFMIRLADNWKEQILPYAWPSPVSRSSLWLSTSSSKNVAKSSASSTVSEMTLRTAWIAFFKHTHTYLHFERLPCQKFGCISEPVKNFPPFSVVSVLLLLWKWEACSGQSEAQSWLFFHVFASTQSQNNESLLLSVQE